MNDIEMQDAIEEQRAMFSQPKGKGRFNGSGKEREKSETKWAVTELQELHHSIKNLVFLGYSNKEIAKQLNCSAQQVSNVKNSPIVKDQLLLMQVAAEGGCVDIQKEIQKLQPHALKTLKEVIETGTLNGDPVATNTRIKECNNIIDRYIGKPTQTVKTQSMNVHFTVEEIKEMQERAKEQMKCVS